MKYVEGQIVDSENPRILEIEDTDFSKDCYVEPIHNLFKEIGFSKAKGSGTNVPGGSWGRNYSIKLTANQYFRFGLLKESFSGYYNVPDFPNFIIKTNKTSSGVGPKGKTYFRNTLKFDGDLILEFIKNNQEAKKEKKQNKTVSKFRKDIILPWVTGNIQEVLPEFEQCHFGSCNIIYGNHKTKAITFSFQSDRMTQKQISEIDFDDIKFNVYFNLKSLSQSFEKNLKLNMVGMKNLFSNFPTVEKEYRKFQVDLDKEIRPVQNIVNKLYAEKQILNKKIEQEKATIESLKEKSRASFEEYLNGLQLGTN